MTETSTVVIAFARTREGEAALSLAVAEAERRQAHLVVLRSGRGGRAEDERDALADEERLEAVDRELTRAGIPHRIVHRVQGHAPEDDIVQVAEQVDADLLVIGLRRRSPVGKAVFGSTTQQVLLRAPCPVLAVPAD